jgi:hypothetical protein
MRNFEVNLLAQPSLQMTSVPTDSFIAISIQTKQHLSLGLRILLGTEKFPFL